MSLGLTNLKTPFLSNPLISFWCNAVNWLEFMSWLLSLSCRYIEMFVVLALIGYLCGLPLLYLTGWGLGLVWGRGLGLVWGSGLGLV